MKPQREFIAERSAAQHCAELLRQGPDPAELLPMLTRVGEQLAKLLGPALAGLLGGDAPRVTAIAPQEMAMSSLLGLFDEIAANSLLAAGSHDIPLLVSLDGYAVLRMVDRAFGGKGEAPVLLPEDFPMSAQLLIQRLEALVAAQIARALGSPDPAAVRPIRREAKLAELAAFDPATPLFVLKAEVAESGRAPWRVTVAVSQEHLADLLGHEGRPALPRSAGSRNADPAAAPFADLPLLLSALLVDMTVPLSAISTLEPGTVLPVAVARAVPVRVGDTVIAHGTVGTQDDRVAIKLTQIA
ncbi:FliM/FliN family flagellar motor switch protein [Novosphingobium sp.]|uniref:FliM/FliN family flagellar motor switch protein n=1 Tax=Novosphingobium sp. TaxID=1874826 RepID=UPI0035ADEE98